MKNICKKSRSIEILGWERNVLTQYIFHRSGRDDSIGGIKSDFFYLEHFGKNFKVLKYIKILRKCFQKFHFRPKIPHSE